MGGWGGALFNHHQSKSACIFSWMGILLLIVNEFFSYRLKHLPVKSDFWFVIENFEEMFHQQRHLAHLIFRSNRQNDYFINFSWTNHTILMQKWFWNSFSLLLRYIIEFASMALKFGDPRPCPWTSGTRWGRRHTKLNFRGQVGAKGSLWLLGIFGEFLMEISAISENPRVERKGKNWGYVPKFLYIA